MVKIYTSGGDDHSFGTAADRFGFFGATPVGKPTVTGSRGANASTGASRRRRQLRPRLDRSQEPGERPPGDHPARRS